MPVPQTGAGVESDHRAASTNHFPSAAWLISPPGVQLLPASILHPPHLSEDVVCLDLFYAARQHEQTPDSKQLTAACRSVG